MARIVLLAALAALIGACGTERQRPEDPLAVAPPRNFTRATEPRTGLSVEVPRNWTRAFREDPGLFRVWSGAAEVSGWAYERAEPLPADREALAAARDALVAEAKRRNPTLRVDSTRLTEVTGAQAIEITGSQEIEGRRVRTRSVHFFHEGTEYVIEAHGPPRAFAVADGRVLRRLLAGLRFEEPAG